MNKITVYTTDKCPQCKIVKSFLSAYNIDFDEIKVDSPEKAEQIEELTGQRKVPVIQTAEDVIVGFDQDQIKSKIVQRKQ